MNVKKRFYLKHDKILILYKIKRIKINQLFSKKHKQEQINKLIKLLKKLLNLQLKMHNEDFNQQLKRFDFFLFKIFIFIYLFRLLQQSLLHQVKHMQQELMFLLFQQQTNHPNIIIRVNHQAIINILIHLIVYSRTFLF